MGLFTKHNNGGVKSQFLNVIEWTDFEDDMLFYKWPNAEIKKGSKLVLRPGQAAIFVYNGNIEGRFDTAGSFDIETEIVPFLSTLKGFKFGFDSGMRAEILFINTKEVLCRWGTQNPIMLPYNAMPGGLPLRVNGTFIVKVSDYVSIINNIAGVQDMYRVDEIRERIMDFLEPAFISIISTDGVDMLNLQAHANEVSQTIFEDCVPELRTLGFELVKFTIRRVSYPKEIQDRIIQNASLNMLGDVNKMQQVAMADSLTDGSGSAGNMASSLVGMTLASQLVGKTCNQQPAAATSMASSTLPKFCPNCGTPTCEGKFCHNCGAQLII